jgi:hypothetical protein
MQVFSMRLYWKIGQVDPPDPGLIPLSSMQERLILEEADKIWFEYTEELDPPPSGYVIYETRTGKIVHERMVGGPRPEATPGAVKETALVKRRPPRWWWPWN